MLIYILTYTIAIIATYNAQRCKMYSISFYINTIFAIVPLSLLAALRDSNVGSDTPSYIYFFENAVSSNSLMDYVSDISSVEFLFLLYNYTIALLTSSVVTYFFITYGIMLSLFYISAMKLRDVICPHIFITIFLFLFWGESLNAMRQYIAMSILVYGIATLIRKNKYFEYIVCTIIGMLFHSSAILSLVIGGVFFLTSKRPITGNKTMYVILCLFMIFAIANLSYFLNLGLLESSAQERYSGYIAKNEGYVSNSHIVIFLATVCVLFYKHKNNQLADLFLLMALFAFIYTFAATISNVFSRIATYFAIITCFSISYTYKSSILNRNTKTLLNVLLCMYVYYYFFSFVINGSSEVVPYSSKILGI